MRIENPMKNPFVFTLRCIITVLISISTYFGMYENLDLQTSWSKVKFCIGMLSAACISLIALFDKSFADSTNPDSAEEIESEKLIRDLVELCHFSENQAKMVVTDNIAFARILVEKAMEAQFPIVQPIAKGKVSNNEPV